jgi:hypothetical protein
MTSTCESDHASEQSLGKNMRPVKPQGSIVSGRKPSFATYASIAAFVYVYHLVVGQPLQDYHM